MTKHRFIISIVSPKNKVLNIEIINVEEPHEAYSRLRSIAYGSAGSGRYGQYSSGKKLLAEVDQGFSNGGNCWTSKNGTVIEIKQIH